MGKGKVIEKITFLFTGRTYFKEFIRGITKWEHCLRFLSSTSELPTPGKLLYYAIKFSISELYLDNWI
jgi:hypothetical protein